MLQFTKMCKISYFFKKRVEPLVPKVQMAVKLMYVYLLKSASPLQLLEVKIRAGWKVIAQ